MEPVVPDPERLPAEAAPRADDTGFALDTPDDPPAIDTPEDLPATGDFTAPDPLRVERTLTVADGARVVGPPPLDSLRLSVPGYEILSELGRGGMGVVYLARQIGLNRAVALKMILSGEHAGPAERERFRREAQAVAALQHPNIVQIYDVGEAEGRPYLAFEYVGGGTLADFLDGQPWPAKPAADLVEALARAIYVAHLQGIVHRDLKPANVLLQNTEGGTRQIDRKSEDPLYRIPSTALRVPKITDFGLAKRVEPDSSWSDDSDRTAPADRTRSGAVVGTPSYLAPEQAAGKNRTVGPPADIYALGTILYEVLTGRPPFRGETPLDTLLQVMADDPVPPANLNRKVPRDLQTVCLKCLQKEPRKRYATAGELADDLHRFQRGESVTARPVGRWQRAVKWMNRHPAATVLGITSAIAVVSLLIVSLYYNVELQLAADRTETQAINARNAEARALIEKKKADDERIEAEKQKADAIKARQEAEAKKREAERGVYALQLFKAAALGERDPQRALRLLDDRNRCPEELRDFTWRYIRGQCLVSEQVIGVHKGPSGIPPVARVAQTPDGKLVATVSGLDPQVRVYDVASRRLLFVLAGHTDAVNGVAIATDGKTVATAGGDHTVRIWELPTDRPRQPTQVAPRFTLRGHRAGVNAVTFSPDGKRLASGGADGLVRIWDFPPTGGKDGGRPTAAAVLKEHTGAVTAVAWAPDGLFSAGADARVLLLRLQPGGGKAEELFQLKSRVQALAVSPDGELLAAAGDAEPDEDEPTIQLYRPLTDRKAGQLRGHTGLAVYDLSFAPDGKRLVSAGRDGTVRVWDVSAMQERAVFRPEREPRPSAVDASVRSIRAVAFGPDGLSVISGGQDGAIRQWNFAGQREEEVELDVRAPLAAAVLSADGQVLAVAEKVLKQVKVWHLGDPSGDLNPKPSRVLAGLNQPPVALAVNENGSLIAAATADGVYVWRAGRNADATRVTTRRAVSLALRGDDLVIATEDWQLLWLNVRTGRSGFSLGEVIGRPSLVAFSPDGRKLITAGTQALQVWDASTGELLFGQVLAHIRRITALAVRPGDTTGEWNMATADEGGLVKVWDLKPRPPAEDGTPHPSGHGLIVSERPAPAGLNDAVQSLAFTADGRTLATGGADRVVRLRDPETGQERAALAGHTDTVLLVAFRADRVLVTVGREGFARVWRAGK